ncbi:hypothetical protein PC128_g23080, partial [Phytophthora cactorum]
LPLLNLAEENVKMAQPMTLEELSEDDGEVAGDRQPTIGFPTRGLVLLRIVKVGLQSVGGQRHRRNKRHYMYRYHQNSQSFAS